MARPSGAASVLLLPRPLAFIVEPWWLWLVLCLWLTTMGWDGSPSPPLLLVEVLFGYSGATSFCLPRQGPACLVHLLSSSRKRSRSYLWKPSWFWSWRMPDDSGVFTSPLSWRHHRCSSHLLAWVAACENPRTETLRLYIWWHSNQPSLVVSSHGGPFICARAPNLRIMACKL
jgi:hypothetical protein